MLAAIQQTVATQPIVSARSTVAEALNRWGIGNGLVGGDLALLQRELPYTFAAAPMIGVLGSTGPRAAPPAAAPMVRQRIAPRQAPPAPERLTLRAVFRQYARPAAPTAPATTTRRWQAAPLTSSTFHAEDAQATPHDRSVLAGLLAAEETADAPGSVASVPPGTTLLWDLDPTSQRVLSADGQVPLRVTAFDRQ